MNVKLKILFLSSLLLLSCQIKPKISSENNDSNMDSLKPRNTQVNPAEFIVIGHRGASGYLPEHTLESYQKAIDQGADFIEPDLVVTKDQVLVARHENEISETTNVKEIYPDRKTTKTVDDVKITGWFVEDFTFEEIKKLKARQRLPNRPQNENDKFSIPSFEEILQLVRKNEETKKRKVGVIPETKHPSYFRSLGLGIEDNMLNLLSKYGFENEPLRVYIQSFEIHNLKELRKKTKYVLIQLIGESNEKPFDESISYADMMTLSGLKKIATYADGIGPYKKWLVKKDEEGHPVATDEFKNALLLNLKLIPYTFRNESYFLLPFFKSPSQEYEFFIKNGVTGVFSDFPDTAIRAKSILSH